MSKFEVKNVEGKQVAEAELADAVYGIEPNIHVMHHIVTCQQACWRQGTQSTKGRSEVSGGGKKPWRQKSHPAVLVRGSIRAAQWRGGGVIFGPKPRTYVKRMNNKEVKLAMRSARPPSSATTSSCSWTTTVSRSRPPRPLSPCSRLWVSRASV